MFVIKCYLWLSFNHLNENIDDRVGLVKFLQENRDIL